MARPWDTIWWKKCLASIEQCDEAPIALKFDRSEQIGMVAHRLGAPLSEPATGWAPQSPIHSVFAVAGILQRNSVLGASQVDQEKTAKTAARQ